MMKIRNEQNTDKRKPAQGRRAHWFQRQWSLKKLNIFSATCAVGALFNKGIHLMKISFIDYRN